MKIKHIISPIAGMALASIGLLMPLATHAQYVNYDDGMSPYDQFRPTAATEITGTIAQNIGSMVLVRSGGQDVRVHLANGTQILDRNNLALGVNALDIGTLVRVVGIPRLNGIVASTIIVLSGPYYPFDYGYSAPIIIQPYEYLLPWNTFVQRHPRDAWRWRTQWEGHQRGDRDRHGGQSRDWDRDRDGRQHGPPPVTPPRHRPTPL